jgi:nitrogen fixation negative regulator NifL
MWSTLRDQQAWTGELLNKRKDGGLYLAEVTITPILGQAGKTEYFLGMHRDVTEVRRLERRVQNQKALIESVVDVAPIAFALLDERGHVVLDNHEYKKLIGDLGVKEPAAQVLAALRAEMGEAFDEAETGGRGFDDREVRVEHPSKGEPRWFSCSGNWFEEQDTSTDAFLESVPKTYMLLAMKEVTAAKREQEQQRIGAVRTMMADAALVQSLRETLAAAIYQLQGPLNLIQAAVNVVQRRSGQGDREALADVLQQALESGQRSLATLKASMPGEPEEAEVPVNLNEILRDVLMLLTGSLLAAGITVEWKPAPVLPAINARPNLLRNMFKQLMENAIEAMNEKGRTLRELRISTSPDTERVCVHIEDTGPGIPEPLRIKVFEPFFTTKDRGTHSVGMGLAMAQEVVSRHNGMMEIDAKYTHGCRIELRFPTSRSRPT